MSTSKRFRLSMLAPILLLVLLGGVAGCGAKGDLVRPAATASASG